jgi:hypothetical protein
VCVRAFNFSPPAYLLRDEFGFSLGLFGIVGKSWQWLQDSLRALYSCWVYLLLLRARHPSSLVEGVSFPRAKNLLCSLSCSTQAHISAHIRSRQFELTCIPAISAAVYDQLDFFAQWSAAAYCGGNNNSTGTKITCPQGNCARVEADDTTTLTEFEK